MKKNSNIKFFSRLLSVFMSVVALLCLFSPYAVAEDAPKFDENDVKWYESKAQAYYRQNNLKVEEFSEKYKKMQNYLHREGANDYNFMGSSTGIGSEHNAKDVIVSAFKYLQSYTGQEGRDDFGGGWGADSSAVDMLQAINNAVSYLLTNNHVSLEDAETIYDEANRLYKIGSERAYLAAKAAGRTGRVERIREQNDNIKDIGVCSKLCLPSCYYNELASCTFCPLFEAVFTAASKIARHATNVFSRPLIAVVAIGFAIWIAMQILAFVATPEVRDLKDLASALIVQSFVVILVLVILNGNVLTFFNKFISPVYIAGQALAQKTIDPVEVNKQIGNFKGNENIQKYFSIPCVGSSVIPDGAKAGLPKAMGDSILCTMTTIHNRVAQIKALASATMCYSWKEKFIIIPKLSYFLVGVGLWVCAMILLLVIPFMMVDSVFQMAVAAALLPFAIASYAFKITRGYTKKVWETFLNSTMLFVVVTVTALILTEALQQTILDSTQNLQSIFSATNDVVMAQILEYLPWYSPRFMQVLFVGILSWGAIQSTKNFGGEFASSISSTNFGSQIATMGGSFTKSAATKIMEPTAKAAWRQSKSLASTVAMAPIHGIRRAARRYQINHVINDSRTKMNAKGEYVLETSRWWGAKKVRKVVQNADGSYYWVKEKFDRKGNLEKRVTKADNFTTREKIKQDDDGNDITAKTRFRTNSALAQDMILNDGSISNDYENMLASIVGDSDVAKRLRLAIAQKVMQQRMPNYSRIISKHSPQVGDLKNFGDGSWGYVTTLSDGTKITAKIGAIQIGADGKKRMMTTYEILSADGKHITQLKSDGIINRKISGTTSDGTMQGLDGGSAEVYHDIAAHLDRHRQFGRQTYVNKQLQHTLFAGDDRNAALADIAQNKNSLNMFEFKKHHKV